MQLITIVLALRCIVNLAAIATANVHGGTLRFSRAAIWLRSVGPCVPHFAQFTLKHLHETVRIRMVVDSRAMSLAPAEDHQVELAIASVD